MIFRKLLSFFYNILLSRYETDVRLFQVQKVWWSCAKNCVKYYVTKNTVLHVHWVYPSYLAINYIYVTFPFLYFFSGFSSGFLFISWFAWAAAAGPYTAGSVVWRPRCRTQGIARTSVGNCQIVIFSSSFSLFYPMLVSYPSLWSRTQDRRVVAVTVAARGLSCQFMIKNK